MTEFEMAYLFNDMWIQINMLAQFYFTMLTAFLVASYVAAHRLTIPMAIVVIGAFVFTSIGTIRNIYLQVQTMLGLATQMKALAQSGKGLAWHSVANMPPPLSGGIIGPVMLTLITAAAVYFFFHCRRVNRKAEAGTWKPKV
jgi:hypothetical protein